jgi:hypothetical protein
VPGRGPPRLWKALAVAALTACGTALPLARASGGGEAEPSLAEEAAHALSALESPFLQEREEGVSDLIRLGAVARPLVAKAFDGARPETKRLLVRVWAADASPESLDRLLTLLPQADPALATAIQRALIEHAEAVEPRVRAYRDAGGQVPSRIAELEELLRRARVERIFVSRKSRSGTTGYYRGQFDALLPDREMALKTTFHILANRSMKVPGEYPSGTYRYLRKVPTYEEAELRLMAANAVAELVRPEDEAILKDLEALFSQFEEELQGNVRANTIVDSLDDVVLVTLARVGEDGRGRTPFGGGETWQAVLEDRLERLEKNDPDERLPGLLLRAHRYKSAVQVYETRLETHDLSPSLTFYNMACAYAMWSREPGVRDAASLRAEAMRNLKHAVEKGYLDWPWMEQDRDLDPVRDLPAYAALLAEVKKGFEAPPSAIGGGR